MQGSIPRLRGLALGWCAIAALLPAAARAQAVDYGTLEQIFGEPITTSATGKPQRASEVPADMTIITADDIRRSGADNIPDILRFVTGIDVRSYSFADTQVGLNGYDSPTNSRLLVLVDGRQVYIDNLGYEAWNTIPVQLDEIRQIEVVRGPTSALFGFNAASGVINIVTYDPLLDKVNAVTVRGGNLAYGGGDAVATQHFGRTVGVRVSVGGWTANGYRNPVATYAPAPRYASFNADARWQATPDILIHASGGVTDANTDRAINGAPEEDFQNHFTYWRLGGTADTKIGTIDVDAYQNSGIDNTRVAPTGGRQTIDTSVYRAADVAQLDAANTIRLGLEYRQSAATSLLLLGGTPSYRLFAASAMWDWQISPRFELTNAVRLDHTALHFSGNLLLTPGRTLQAYDTSTTTAPSFNSALVIHATDTDTVRLTLARGLQLPSIFDYGFQIPFDFGLPNPNGRPVALVGSPDVRPAAVWHAEIGYTRPVAALQANFQASLFFERNTNLLAPGGSTSFASVGKFILSQSENIGSSNEAGVQIALSRRQAGKWRWNLSYGYARITDDIEAGIPANEITRYARGTPTHIIVAGIGYGWDRWEADMQGRWQSSYVDYQYPGPFPLLINNYITFNARLAFRVIDGLTVAGIVEQMNRSSLLEAAGDRVDRRFIASATLRY